MPNKQGTIMVSVCVFLMFFGHILGLVALAIHQAKVVVPYLLTFAWCMYFGTVVKVLKKTNATDLETRHTACQGCICNPGAPLDGPAGNQVMPMVGTVVVNQPEHAPVVGSVVQGGVVQGGVVQGFEFAQGAEGGEKQGGVV